ncbi:TPD1 protein homolog 1 [Arachis duranensis]|uniref:TPD1 protein homolog 1 n=1 Tax=Arachis duranensis TaxID=130453 RepID=A0A6P4AWY1_ARADU|nr:TPD1 protein homolog 1 [Arachis duranensis]
MAVTNNIIIGIFLFFALVSQCYSQCRESDLFLTQKPTGAKVKGKPEWQVDITANCAKCDFRGVSVFCSGFQTVEPINTSILGKEEGGLCLVANGRPITHSQPVTFKYASDTSFPFHVLKQQIVCT